MRRDMPLVRWMFMLVVMFIGCDEMTRWFGFGTDNPAPESRDATAAMTEAPPLAPLVFCQSKQPCPKGQYCAEKDTVMRAYMIGGNSNASGGVFYGRGLVDQKICVSDQIAPCPPLLDESTWQAKVREGEFFCLQQQN